MSNAVAVAAVTETLSRVIETAARAAVPGASVTNGRPSPPPPTTPTRVGVYLYRVAENPHLRADDLPTRTSGGAVLTRPQIALNLDYLVTFYGAAEELEAERMLGRVVATLHARPVLSPEAIQAAIDDELGQDTDSFLGEADLAQQVEGVRVTPLDLGLDDMSKLWSVFFQEPYALSVAYTVSVVLIEYEATRDAPLPVHAHGVRAVPTAAPFITSVVPAAVAYPPTGAALLTLRGSALASERVVARFGTGQAVEVDGEVQFVTNERIVAVVPPTLPAGVHVVHVAHLVDWGTPSAPDLRPVIESNRVAFALQPEIVQAPASVARPGPLAIEVNPELQPGQRVRLVLRQTAASASGAPLAHEQEQTVAAAGRAVSFDLTDAPAGDFWLRIAVDEVTSPLQADATGLTGPTVTIT